MLCSATLWVAVIDGRAARARREPAPQPDPGGYHLDPAVPDAGHTNRYEEAFMTTNRPVGSQPGEPDLPTAAAVLKVTAQPTKGWSAVANVPPADAHFLIATFGIMWSIATSTAGVMLVYRFAPYLAVAEVGLGLAAIAAIALCGRGSRTISRPAPTVEETAIGPRQAGRLEMAAGTKRGTSRP